MLQPQHDTLLSGHIITLDRVGQDCYPPVLKAGWIRLRMYSHTFTNASFLSACTAIP